MWFLLAMNAIHFTAGSSLTYHVHSLFKMFNLPYVSNSCSLKLAWPQIIFLTFVLFTTFLLLWRIMRWIKYRVPNKKRLTLPNITITTNHNQLISNRLLKADINQFHRFKEWVGEGRLQNPMRNRGCWPPPHGRVACGHWQPHSMPEVMWEQRKV